MRIPTLHFRERIEFNWSYKYIVLLDRFWRHFFKNIEIYYTQYTFLSIANVDVAIVLPSFLYMLKKRMKGK